MTSGYYRYPTIHEDTIVFVSEDDLWTVPASGGVARRLTSNLGEVTYPMLSPDGTLLAYVGREEGGSEVYVMPAEGGSGRRLTYLNSNCRVAGWTQDSRSILFASNYGQVSSSEMGLFRVDADAANGAATQLPIGPARAIAFGPDGGVVIGQHRRPGAGSGTAARQANCGSTSMATGVRALPARPAGHRLHPCG